ncbi:MAG: hypothetical protein HZB35_07000 [Nitrospirae bacterium]|nr:hypothetical protein [Nitrospirota bacterium]
MIRANNRRWLAACTLAAWLVGLPAFAGADELTNRFGFGTDFGFWSGTVDGTRFAMSFNIDYYVDRAFSIGGMMLLSPVGDLTNVGFAGLAKYHYRMGAVNLVPFAGLGLLHSDLDKGSGPGRIDRNDTSHWIPIGLSAEYQLTPKLALANTLMFNIHSINLSPSVVERDTTSVTLLFGFRFGP